MKNGTPRGAVFCSRPEGLSRADQAAALTFKRQACSKGSV